MQLSAQGLALPCTFVFACHSLSPFLSLDLTLFLCHSLFLPPSLLSLSLSLYIYSSFSLSSSFYHSVYPTLFLSSLSHTSLLQPSIPPSPSLSLSLSLSLSPPRPLTSSREQRTL